jgi:hypothetical protein
VDVQTGDADGGVGLVDAAEAGNALVALEAALAVDQAGGAVIAGARVDAVETDHGRQPPSVNRRCVAEDGICSHTYRTADNVSQ